MADLEEWQLRSRKYVYGQVDWLNRDLETASIHRGPNAHEPVPCLEVYGHPWQRLYQCPVCKEGRELDVDSKAIGVSCAGDAWLEDHEE